MNEKIKTILRCIFWFIISFILLWISGIGLLFENSNPIKALLVFSGIMTVIFESINQIYLLVQNKIKELEKRIEELENKSGDYNDAN